MSRITTTINYPGAPRPGVRGQATLLLQMLEIPRRPARPVGVIIKQSEPTQASAGQPVAECHLVAVDHRSTWQPRYRVGRVDPAAKGGIAWAEETYTRETQVHWRLALIAALEAWRGGAQ